jgi:gliding motility-associated-like protein
VKKSLLSIFVFLLTSNLFSQVLIDQTKTPAQLTVQDLIGNGVTVTNITFNGSAANANVLRNQIALFTNGENSTVGIERGVVLTTGNSLVAQIGTGFTNPPFAQQGGASSNSTTAVVGDADLSLLVTDDVRNAAVLEFDFVATSAFVEFRYVFASEEYPEYTPCESSDPVNDVFGFFISGPGISGPYSNNATNIALIPGTTLPISINNINQCSAFNSFYVDNAAFIDPNTGLVNPNTVQYDGMTTILTARANVQCGETYHIKIAIANVFDNGFDSAVFLQANSFSIPTVDLGPDRSFCGTATCFDLQATFDQNLPVGFNPSYNWYLNGVLQTTTTVPTLNICQSGEWRVDVFTPGCAAVVATDSVQINFISAVPFNPIGPISGNAGECNPVFNLLSYQAALVAPQDPANFTFVYYDENFDVITDPANFSPISNTIVGIDISVGTCSSFDIVEFIVDCDPVSCSLNLTSATETTNQTICLGETITDITYTFGGDATNVTVVDLPAGVTTTIASGILTISGTPSTTGSFTYTVSSVGCSPELTLQGTITIADAPTFTNLSAVSPICEGEDAVFTLVGSAGATVEYTINGGAIQTETLNAAGEVIITIPAVTANTTIEVSEIAIGSCIVALNETATVVVNPIPAVPTIDVTAPTCVLAGFATITNYDATLTYTFTPAGPTITAVGLIENMVVGTSYTVTAENTTCTSADSAAFSNAAQLVTPDIPTITITAPTCLAAGFTTITNYVAGMTYDFTPAGPTVDGTGLISGMTFGTSYEVAANNGSCSSINTAPFSIEDILVTPAVPTVATTAPTCTADGFTEITNYDATLTYIFTPAGPTITAAGLIENMVVGTSYTVTAGNTTCTSADSAAFSNAAQLVTPDIPTITITAPTCLAAGFATITNYVAGMTYDFTPVGPTVDGTGLISGMAFGTSYEVAANNGSCSSINTAPFSIENILVTPAVPTVATTAPTCTADGFTEITNYDATLTYTFTPVGPTITAAGLIENMVVGTSYTVTAENTTCTSADSAAFSNAAQLVTPDVPTIAITAPTCLAAGFATITNYNGALTYTFTPTGPTVGAGGLISGMTVGTSYTVTAGNGTCTSLASTSFSNAAQLPAPVVTSVTNNGPICEGGNIVFTIIGTPNAVVSYSGVVGVPASTVTLNASGQATVTVAGATSNQTITLNTVTNSITGCSATISNTSTATVLPLPTANLSSANPATCSGGSVVLNFTGTPNAIVSFTDGTNNYNVTLDGTGVNNYTTPPISSTTTFTLTSVATTATPSCSQLVGDSVTVVITPRPIMTASPNPLVLCNGATMNLVLNSDVAGTTYTWSASTTNIEGSFVLDGDGTDINQLVQLQDPTVVGFVTIVVIPRANNCDGDAVTIQVVVNPVPEITDVNVSAETICSNNEVSISVVGIPSGLSYTWQAINNNGVTIVGGVTSGTSATGDIDVTLVTTNPLVAGTIQFEITPIRNGCTGVSVVTPVITVNPIPGTPIGLPISEICSGENANLNISVTPLMTGTELDWEVVEAVNITAGYATQGSGVSPILIDDILINETDQQGFIRYRVTSRLNGCIGNTTDFIVRVNPLPRPTLQDGAICVDGSGVTFQTYVLQSGISGAMYDFDWYYNDTLIAGATGNTYTATQPGTYSLIVTNTITGCISEEVFANVIEVQPATAVSATVTDAFSDNATITVSVTGGTGTLLYQLDDEGFQESNVFTGVSAGLHTVTVIDTQGCTYLTIEVLVIDYPPFFTPNGDGFNDTWNIFSLNGQTNVKIYIFDRYGKLLKQISPQGQGWDGRFNGAELPSTDYWFTVDYLENEQPKTFKAHFSLIR